VRSWAAGDAVVIVLASTGACVLREYLGQQGVVRSFGGGAGVVRRADPLRLLLVSLAVPTARSLNATGTRSAGSRRRRRRCVHGLVRDLPSA